MQFKAAVAVLALFAGVVSTQSMAFHEADTGGTCGKSACQEGACILEVNGISGCTGQTDGISGSVLPSKLVRLMSLILFTDHAAHRLWGIPAEMSATRLTW